MIRKIRGSKPFSGVKSEPLKWIYFILLYSALLIMSPPMSPEAKARLKVMGGYAVAIYLFIILLMHVPPVARSVIGGTRYMIFDPEKPGFCMVERSWWGGDTYYFRYKITRDDTEPEFKRWHVRLERVNDREVSVDSKEGEWDYIEGGDEDSYSFAVPVWKTWPALTMF